MKKVALVVNSFPKVSEIFIFNKALELAKNGFDISVVSHTNSADEHFFSDRLVAGEIKILRSPYSLKNRWAIIRQLLFNPGLVIRILKDLSSERISPGVKLKKVLKLMPFYKNKFAIIHFEFSGLAVQYLDVFDLLSAKTMVSCRGTAELVKPIVEIGRGEKLSDLFSKVDQVHCVSEHMRRALLTYGLIPEKSFVNYPSVDTDFFSRHLPYSQRQIEDVWKLLSVGRLNWIKGYDSALRALRILKKKGFKIRYEIYGRGDAYEPLKFLIHEYDLENTVFLPGIINRKEVLKQLEQTDIFLQPSLSEGISNAALEAMAMKVPVVSSNAGGMPEAIIHGETGLVFEKGDANQMADCLENLILSFEMRQTLGANGRKIVQEKFNLSNQTVLFQSAYYNLFQTQ